MQQRDTAELCFKHDFMTDGRAVIAVEMLLPCITTTGVQDLSLLFYKIRVLTGIMK